MNINKYYQTIAEEINSKIGRLNALTNHGPSIGSFHEAVLKEVIMRMLPKRFSIITGIIVDDDNRSSKQQDIIIVDENNPNAYLFKEGEFSVVHYKSVVFTVEVKTTLNKTNFIDALANCDSVGKLGGGNRIQRSAFFYYSTKINSQTLSKWYSEVHIEDSLLNYPNQIVVFNKAILMLQLHKDNGTCGHHLFWDTTKPNKIDGDLLAIFLGTIRKFCNDNMTQSMPLEFSVLNQQRLLLSHDYFAFGKGAVQRDKL